MGMKNILLVSALSALLPTTAIAQGSGISGPTTPPRVSISLAYALGILNNATGWLFSIFLILSVIFMIFAAFAYLTSGGEPEKVRSATRRLVFVLVALVVAYLSTSIPYLVQDLLGIQVI